MIAKPILTVAALALCSSNLLAGDLTGKVTLKGTPPPEKDIAPLKNDANCGPLVKDMPKTQFFVTGADGALADAVVVIKGLEGKSAGASAAPLIVDQRGCLYIPQIATVQTGQKIIVKNSDPVLHNVHTTPGVAGNEEKNLAQMPNAADLEFSFAKPEDFLRFKCDVHPWMFAWVTVVDHPYVAISGKDGTYKIANVPPGKYTVEVKHRKGAPDGVAQEVEVTDAGASADFVIELK